MSLDDKVAYWVDLGTTPYQETFQLQLNLAELRRKNGTPDIILATQHLPEVSFGNIERDNQFSNAFLNQMESRYGPIYTQEQILDELRERGIGFSKTARSGGATVFSPGQLVYYPITAHQEITGSQLDISTYKRKIYEIMFSSLQSLGVNGIQTGSDQAYATRNERKDIWIQKNGIPLKMGSKGIKFSGSVAYHGFSLYINHEGLEHMHLVKPCGYTPDEAQTISVEEVVGRRIPDFQVHQSVLGSIQQTFGYRRITQISPNHLQNLLNQSNEVAA